MLLLAMLVDVLFGEPPERFHPVVWMGRGLAWLEARAPCSARARLAFGAVAALGHLAVWGCLAALVQRVAPWPVQALVLKPAFAGRALLEAALRVECSLHAARLVEARQGLAALVSRPTAELGPSLVAAAAIESLAENLVDSWVAPLLAYASFGLSGAYVYRAANTADAMWGYRTPQYEHLGKAAARVDDLLAFVPARLGALLLAVSGPRPRDSLSVWRGEARRTPSPNAGQSIAAMAGQLNVRLEKPGVYVLNAPAPEPGLDDLSAARRLVARAMLLAAVLALALTAARPARALAAARPAWTLFAARPARALTAARPAPARGAHHPPPPPAG